MSKSGWIIREDTPHGVNGRRIAFWWYGPRHGFGNTWGGPELAQTWPTKKAAEEAAAAFLGVGWKRDLKRDITRQAQRVENGVAEANTQSKGRII